MVRLLLGEDIGQAVVVVNQLTEGRGMISASGAPRGRSKTWVFSRECHGPAPSIRDTLAYKGAYSHIVLIFPRIPASGRSKTMGLCITWRGVVFFPQPLFSSRPCVALA